MNGYVYFIKIAGWRFDVRWHLDRPPGANAGLFSADRTRRKARVKGVIDVRLAGTGRTSVRPAWKIKGGREYAGWWDAVSGKGELRVRSAAAPEFALTGFLRQALLCSLPLADGVMLHAACVADGSIGYVFAGRSGAGKSTICALAPTHCRVLSDDMTLLRRIQGEWRAWGWPPRADDRGVRIQKIFRLVQDKRHRVKNVSAALGVAAMLAAPPRGAAPGNLRNILNMCGRLTDDVPVFDLHFTPDTRVWRSVIGDWLIPAASRPGCRRDYCHEQIYP